MRVEPRLTGYTAGDIRVYMCGDLGGYEIVSTCGEKGG